MSAIVCGKRSSSIFDDFPSLTFSKKIRFASSIDYRVFVDRIGKLRSLFPQMDHQLLERVLEECGNDLDSAIKSLSNLCLESTDIQSVAVPVSEARTEANLQFSADVMCGTINGNGNATVNPPALNGFPKDGSEWVEEFVKEMANSRDIDDARARAARVLDVLEKSIVAKSDANTVQRIHEENHMLKGQLEALIKENLVLKRAVAIQHERQKEYDDKSQELQRLKQSAAQYQEQLRTLEVNNYALLMHLRQAQQNNSIAGHFHPDVF